MRVELINTGDELLIGRVVNTHLTFLGDRLLELGLRITRQTAVPDGSEIRDAMAEACGRCEVLVVTGGLGPTSDDITRDVAAELLGRALVKDAGVAEAIGDRLRARGRECTTTTLRQAMVPEGATVLGNPHGTAPGLYVPATGQTPHFFLLPGPPRELRPMVEDYVLPELRRLAGDGGVPEVCHYKFFGVGESEISAKVEAPLSEVPGLQIGYQVEPTNANLRCIGDRDAQVAAREIVTRSLGDYIISTDGRSLEEVVVALLDESGQTVATAESCTGGSIADIITDVPGASRVFRRGFVTYANEAKSGLLFVPADLICEHGAVSGQVAAAMASGCLEASGDDHAIAVTGIAGPGGGSDEKPVGTVFVAVVSRGDAAPHVRRCFFPFDRLHFKASVTKTALDTLRRKLLNLDLA